MTLTGKSPNNNWLAHNMCREVYGVIVSHWRWGKIVGTKKKEKITPFRLTRQDLLVNELKIQSRKNSDIAPLSEDIDAKQQDVELMGLWFWRWWWEALVLKSFSSHTLTSSAIRCWGKIQMIYLCRSLMIQV